jgi:hypothetical protein
MPFFRSTATVPIAFEIGDYAYAVPPEGVCEIDRRYAYVPKARGLPLVEIERSAVGDAVVVEPKPVDRPAPRRVPGVISGTDVLTKDDADDELDDVDVPAVVKKRSRKG